MGRRQTQGAEGEDLFLAISDFDVTDLIQNRRVEVDHLLIADSVQIQVVEDLLLLFQQDSCGLVSPNAMKRRFAVVQCHGGGATAAVWILGGSVGIRCTGGSS